MEDFQLRAVEPGEVTASGAKVRLANRPRSRYALPTDRMKFRAQVDALRAFAVLSKNRQEPVTSDKLAAYLKIASTTAGLNNVFFVESGLIERAGKGKYLPTDLAMEFQRKYSFNQSDAGAVLAPALTQTWYADVVRQRVEFDAATVKDLVAALADEAGADVSFRSQLETLIEWLEFAGVVVRDGDGFVHLAGLAVAPISKTEPEPMAETPVDSSTVPAIAEEPHGVGAGLAFRSGRRPPESHVLSLSFDLRLTAQDLSALSPDQIRQVFEGVGQIAAIKASIGD